MSECDCLLHGAIGQEHLTGCPKYQPPPRPLLYDDPASVERLAAVLADAIGLYSQCHLTHPGHHFPKYSNELARAIVERLKETRGEG